MASEVSGLKYKIKQTWDSRPKEDGAEICVQFSRNSVDKSGRLIINVRAPFYNDPQVSPEIPAGSVNKLWDYEVVEIFLLSDSANKYLEVELAPSGHYLVLELDKQRNILRNELPLSNYTTSISEDGSRWNGTAFIPAEYIPENVNRFNAYAIHKSDPNRVYMSLFPAPQGKYENPNFHRLQYFQSITLPQ